MKTAMYRLTRSDGKPIASFLATDIADQLSRHIADKVAGVVGGSIARSIRRGQIERYGSGNYIVRPMNKRGVRSTTANGDLIAFWLEPYTLET